MTKKATSSRLLAGGAILCVSMAAVAAAHRPAPKRPAVPDARVCLKYTSNIKVAICAERYRPKPRRR